MRHQHDEGVGLFRPVNVALHEGLNGSLVVAHGDRNQE